MLVASKEHDRTFPLVPKSNRQLRPGDFWAVPLWDSSYACARVLELPAPGMPGSRTVFLGALLDWHGVTAPTSDEIAGAGTLDQGKMHVKAIWETGGAILGNRPLALDGVEPWKRCVDFNGWGYLVVKHLAEDHFLRRSTITGRTGAELFKTRRARREAED